ncbi:uncharacterized protein TNIN_346301 [Trichonephila inaurata madagascariensis]|uniref:DUF4817 domain-containing protein n=1 Tax=Trichonephila inaurata madagascariensis TaxID=2747483 RepID=A0A8X7CJ85_9ARAC|nr:uncharacterized protein TNIN_346301 [Trichonephila inaurata madagascariensis]
MAVGMTSYTNQEMVDIIFTYGVADGNALEAQGLCWERIPSKRLPNRKTFECLHRRLRETVSFVSGMPDTGRTRIPELKEHVLHKFEEQPEKSKWTVSTAANVSHMMDCRVLGAESLRPYHAHWVHALNATDHQPRVDFSP